MFSADRNLAAIRPKSTTDSRYLAFALQAPQLQQQIRGASGSTAQPHLYLRDLRALEIAVLPLDHQQRIVIELERQLSILDAQAGAIDLALKRGSALRRAILERAFTGKLIPQDPNEEPASALLERIRAEQPSVKKRTRSTTRT